MSRGDDKTNRWRRFSVRTLLLSTTAICIYFAAWMPTKKHAAAQVKYQLFQSGQEAIAVFETTSPFPLVIVQDESVSNLQEGPFGTRYLRRYYIWLFGPKFKLPWESTWTPGPPQLDDPFGAPTLVTPPRAPTPVTPPQKSDDPFS